MTFIHIESILNVNEFNYNLPNYWFNTIMVYIPTLLSVTLQQLSCH